MPGRRGVQPRLLSGFWLESKKRLPEYMERQPTDTGADFKSSLFFAKSIFPVLPSDPSVRNLKFLSGNAITDGDINSATQQLTKELSMAFYALRTL